MDYKNSGTGLYVHVPFCIKKCIYCDFNSYAYPEDEKIAVHNEYFDALYKELEMVNGAVNEPFETVFIGGGTPSAVNPEYIAGLLKRIPLAKDTEVTTEANPGTLDAKKLAAYRKAGINRISMGVQSFNDDELRFLGRIHSADEAMEAFRIARAAGFDNVNIDLIFGFPGHTLESWKKTLETAIELGPEHISFYSLQIEEGTPLYEMFRRDEAEQISDELNREMYHTALSMLKDAGYCHYEISNAAKEGRFCRHNLKYWTMAPYAGIGAGAHSFTGGTRAFNYGDISDYIESVSKAYEVWRSGLAAADGVFVLSGVDDRAFNETDSGNGFKSENLRIDDLNGSSVERLKHNYWAAYAEEVDNLSRDDLISDFIFTGLRLVDGFSLALFKQLFSEDFEDMFKAEVNSLTEEGLLQFSNEHERLGLTDKGLDLSNYVISRFLK